MNKPNNYNEYFQNSIKINLEKTEYIPKKGTTSYVYFCRDKREKIKSLNPTKKPKDIVILINSMWKHVSDIEKNKYINLAIADKKRYEIEYNQYKKTDFYLERCKKSLNGYNSELKSNYFSKIVIKSCVSCTLKKTIKLQEENKKARENPIELDSDSEKRYNKNTIKLQEENKKARENPIELDSDSEKRYNKKAPKVESEKRYNKKAPKVESEKRYNKKAPKVESEKRYNEKAPKVESEKRYNKKVPKVESEKRYNEKAPKVESEKRYNKKAPKVESEKRYNEKAPKVEYYKIQIIID
jgi:hypothetical protein